MLTVAILRSDVSCRPFTKCLAAIVLCPYPDRNGCYVCHMCVCRFTFADTLVYGWDGLVILSGDVLLQVGFQVLPSTPMVTLGGGGAATAMRSPLVERPDWAFAR